jgi:hypothetical protein
VIEAVALLPTTEHGQFETEEFFSMVERIAQQEVCKEGLAVAAARWIERD